MVSWAYLTSFSNVIRWLKWNVGQQVLSRYFKILVTGLCFSIIAIITFTKASSHPYVASVSNSFEDKVRGEKDDNIPNQIHFIWALNETSNDLIFTFEQYLSVYSAWYYWKPPTIYLHTNADESAIARARDGVFSKWAMRILSMPGVRVNRVDMPNRTKHGVQFRFNEHISDFARVKAVHDFGGVYIDFDVQPLRDIAVLRRSGFNAISGRQRDNNLNSGTFMSTKGGKMVTMWMNMMHEVYDGGWTTHSNDAVTAVAHHLVPEPGEMLIMDREAFAPVGWDFDDAAELFGLHNETSPLEHLVSGQPLPSYDDNPPDWARDFSASYLLHSFTPDWSLHPVEGVSGITPAYVLRRQSNFAYATYPVVSDMYHRGLVTLEDKEQ